VEKYDKSHEAILETSFITDELVVYQAKLKLAKGTHQFKMHFTYNGASYKEGQEVDLYVGISSVVNTYLSGTSVGGVHGGVKLANLQSYIDKHINDQYLLKVKVE